jgi:hypothetical protein
MTAKQATPKRAKPRLQTLHHVTPARNVASILRGGLLGTKSQGARQIVWLCDSKRLAWCLPHIAKHHGVKLIDLAVLTVQLPRGCWTRTGRKGVFHVALVRRADIVDKYWG